MDINLKVRKREKERETMFIGTLDGSRGEEADSRRDRFVFGDLYIRGLLLCGRSRRFFSCLNI